jgi:hypothetical protein
MTFFSLLEQCTSRHPKSKVYYRQQRARSSSLRNTLTYRLLRSKTRVFLFLGGLILKSFVTRTYYSRPDETLHHRPALITGHCLFNTFAIKGKQNKIYPFNAPWRPTGL